MVALGAGEGERYLVPSSQCLRKNIGGDWATAISQNVTEPQQTKILYLGMRLAAYHVGPTLQMVDLTKTRI